MASVYLRAVPTGTIVQPEPANRWSNRTTTQGWGPEELRGLLTDVSRAANLERWADIVDQACREDPLIASQSETRSLAVSSAPIEIEAASQTPDDLAAADLCRKELEGCSHWEQLCSGLLWAEMLGWAGAEHGWHRDKNRWTSTPRLIDPRHIAFASDWSLVVRTFENALPKWVTAESQNAAQFIFHVPIKRTTPVHSGDFHAIAWPWMFRRWAQMWQQQGLEKYATPFMYMLLDPQASDEAKDAAFEGLKNLSASQVGIFDKANEIKIAEPGQKVGDAWDTALERLKTEITIGLLGSTLNTDAGAAGSRALGESQASTTILPRLQAHAKRLAGTIERSWLKPLLEFNSHLFSVAPGVPHLRFKLEQEAIPEIPPHVLQSGTVTKDELRRSVGLPAWGPERGGDDVAVISAGPTAPAQPFAVATEDRQPRPFSGQSSATSQMSRDLARRIASAPFERSGGRES